MTQPKFINSVTQPRYINTVLQFLASKYPQPNPLWNHSTNNTIGSDWLYATPTDVWGKPYCEFEQAVSGDSPNFMLQEYTTASRPSRQWFPVRPGATAPVDMAKNLLVGHSCEIYEAMYKVMVSGKVLVDFTTLTPPTTRFLDAFRDAITCISNKPEAERPIIRILYSNPLPNTPPLTAIPFLHSITHQLDPRKKMTIYVAVMNSSFSSWNHAKIVAADGARSLVGGHNMWGTHYLGRNPVFDVSMALSGEAARHAQDYANGMWNFELWRKNRLDKWLEDADINSEIALHAAYTCDSSGKCSIKPGEYPPEDLYDAAVAKFSAQSTSPGAQVLSIGRGANTSSNYLIPTLYSYLFPFTEPSNEVMLKLIGLSQCSVRMSLQSLGLARGWIAAMSNELFEALGKALLRGVEVQIVLSNPHAVAGGLPRFSAPYDGEPPDAINEKMRLALTNSLDQDDATARQLIDQKFKIASFRFARAAAYDDTAPISNHAKTFMIDDALFYIGSQNQYKSNLNEFGYVVEDTQTVQDYITRYWAPLWHYSGITVTRAFDTDVLTAEQLEAMQFIFSLDQNSRSQVVWNHLQVEYEREAESTRKADIESLMNELIENGGFCTTAIQVRRAQEQPFNSQNPPDVSATPEAIRFVINMMSNTDLMRDFVKVVDAQSASVDAANQAINQFLQQQGYQCTAIQVRTAFVRMRRKILVYWVGRYRTWLTPDQGASFTLKEAGPENFTTLSLAIRSLGAARTADDPHIPVLGPDLIIAGEDDVTFDGEKIKSPRYNNNTLSWSKNDGNTTSAKISLGQVTRPTLVDNFHGMECFGTVTYPDIGNAPKRGTVSIYGRVPSSSPANSDGADRKAHTVLWVVATLSLASLLGVVGCFVFKNRSRPSEYERVGREKYAQYTGDYMSMDDGEPVATRDRQMEVDMLSGAQLRRQIVVQEDQLREFAKYESAMGSAQQISMAGTAKNLKQSATDLSDPDPSELNGVVHIARRQLKATQTSLSDLLIDLSSEMSATARSQVTTCETTSTEIARDIDSYFDDQAKGDPIENFDWEV